jgi:hypothetical protein
MSPKSVRTCPYCGRSVSAQAVFCTSCGKPLTLTPQAEGGAPQQVEQQVQVARGSGPLQGGPAATDAESLPPPAVPPPPASPPSVPSAPPVPPAAIPSGPPQSGALPSARVEQNVQGALGTVIGVLQGDIGAVSITGAPPESRPRPPRDQIGPLPEAYVPRPEVEEKLLALLKARLPGPSLVELYGLPGSGKSVVGRKVALDLAAEFPDGRLWIDVLDRGEVDMLCSLIDPFEAPPERDPYLGASPFLSRLQAALGRQRILIVFNRVGPEDQERLRHILSFNCPHVAILIISEAHLPELVDDAHSVYLPEMTSDQAEALFRLIWKDAYQSAPASLLQALAAELNYLPTQISLVARDILNRQVAPADYLDELRRRKSARLEATAANMPGFHAVYENLPDQGRRVLPFLAVIGASPWTAETLVAVSPLTMGEVVAGLRQLALVGIVQIQEDGRLACSPVAREFALSIMYQQGGESLVHSARNVMIQYNLRQALEFSALSRQSLLKDFLDDDTRRNRFIHVVRDSLLPDESSRGHGDTMIQQATPGLGDYDLVQEVFERVVLEDPEFQHRWLEWIASSAFMYQTHNLEEALRWAIQQEDWGFVRRFASLSIGCFVPKMVISGDRDGTTLASINGFSLGALRGLRLSNVNLETSLWGVRIISPRISHTAMITVQWGGVHLRQGSLSDVDMVSAYLPGLVARDLILTNVDLRGADLRGAVFYNCAFARLNLRYADLSGAQFINIRGSGLDLRGANLQGVGFSNNFRLTDVTYYKSDADKLPPM